MKKNIIYTYIKRIIFICISITAYRAIYLICTYRLFRVLYTPRWTTDHVLWPAAVISVIPSFWGAYRFTFITLIGYILGVISGELFGGYKVHIPPQYKHYGWFIWACVFTASIIIGIIIEVLHKRKYKKKRIKLDVF